MFDHEPLQIYLYTTYKATTDIVDHNKTETHE